MNNFNPIFSTETQVRIHDINHGNHLDFAKLIEILGNTRALFFRQHNIPDVASDGIGIITKSVDVNYLKQAHFGDILQINLSVQVVKRIQLNFGFEVRNKISQLPIATGQIGIIFFNYNTNSPTRVPDFFITLCNSLSDQKLGSSVFDGVQ